ncbi:hypothetical protein [Bosea beijingensis]|uniref:hypothetical protein n=1 Tax=Bosea beijingensis TaxID=3068632 RepID=UPI00274047DE|nr:hypothetical protein [Bosea sp. REN20]
MMRNLIAATATLLTVLVSLPASAQFDATPGNGPLYPGGPRQGLGPPSITDNVPDIRLRSSQGGIPGAGPPVGAGAPSPRFYEPSASSGRSYRHAERTSGLGRHCRTPARQCTLARPASLGDDCSCRTSKGRRQGFVVR